MLNPDVSSYFSLSTSCRVVNNTSVRITFFGDSICVGQGISITDGWVINVAKELQAFSSRHSFDVLISNSSVNGRTTRGALDDFPYQIQESKTDILIMQFGLNDCNYWTSDRGLPRVSRRGYLANLQELVDRSEKCGIRQVLIVTNHPTTRQKELMPNSNITFEQSNFNYYQDLILLSSQFPEFVSLLDVRRVFIDSINNSSVQLEDLLLEDGLHLSRLGHKAYADFLGPQIIESVKNILYQHYSKRVT